MSNLPDLNRNRLLGALPTAAQTRLWPFLELVTLPTGRLLYESGSAPHHVHFPVSSVISLLYVMENGASTEISMVGNEGAVGFALFMGGETTTSRALVRSAGLAFRIHGERVREELDAHAELMTLMLRYTQALITQVAQTAVCNRHHAVDQQICRWLLLTLDRQSGNQLSLTQEQIAGMLGVRREGVTDAAGKLQKLGAIEYHRGHITILDRAILEAHSCECYAVVKTETDRLTCPHVEIPRQKIPVRS